MARASPALPGALVLPPGVLARVMQRSGGRAWQQLALAASKKSNRQPPHCAMPSAAQHLARASGNQGAEGAHCEMMMVVGVAKKRIAAFVHPRLPRSPHTVFRMGKAEKETKPKKEKKEKDPNAPKRSLSGYMFFSKARLATHALPPQPSHALPCLDCPSTAAACPSLLRWR